jgi:hypothetical protein
LLIIVLLEQSNVVENYLHDEMKTIINFNNNCGVTVIFHFSKPTMEDLN